MANGFKQFLNIWPGARFLLRWPPLPARSGGQARVCVRARDSTKRDRGETFKQFFKPLDDFGRHLKLDYFYTAIPAHLDMNSCEVGNKYKLIQHHLFLLPPQRRSGKHNNPC